MGTVVDAGHREVGGRVAGLGVEVEGGQGAAEVDVAAAAEGLERRIDAGGADLDRLAGGPERADRGGQRAPVIGASPTAMAA
jgi:hypothetical protein